MLKIAEMKCIMLNEVPVETIIRIWLLVLKSCPTLVTPWTGARQAPRSMGFSRQEHWSGLSFPPAGHLPDAVIEPGSHALQAEPLLTELSTLT